MKRVKFLPILFLLIVGLCCKDEPTKTEHRALQLTAEDASCTEAYLRLEVWTKPSTVILQRGDSTIATLQLTTTDTLIVDEGLQPSHTYQYSAQLITPIPPVWLDDNLTSQVQVQTMDTTSHDFTWQTFTLGDGTGSSCLYDVAIINDTLAYAVGEIYQDYNKDYQIYNAAKWNGREWELMRIPCLICGSNSYVISSIRTILAFNENDIWFSDGGEIIHWDGTKYTNDCSMNSWLTGAINKLWGTSSRDLYAVGNNGLIAHYDGVRWERIESGVTNTIQDIWGAYNKKTGRNDILCGVAAAYSIGNAALLSINADKTVSVVSWVSGRRPYSIWFKDISTVFTCGDGVFCRDVRLEWKEIAGVNVLNEFTNRIRGQDDNDVFIVSDFGTIVHFNGIGFHIFAEVRNMVGTSELFSCAYKENNFIAVGSNGRAVIAMGKK